MKKFFVLMLALFPLLANAQFFTFLNEELYSSRVKLVDEFMERFNGRESRTDLVKKGVDDHKTNILLLFDLAMFQSKSDLRFLEAESFAQNIVRDSIRINYSDTTWCAKAKCHGTLSGKPVDFFLYLTVEHRKEDMYKWVLARAEGKIFNLDAPKEHKPFMLMPDDHETNFMSLYRMTAETPSYIKDFMSKSNTLDQTSVFQTLVCAKLLKIEYVSELEFLFFQVPGYMFSIKHVERESLNAGWLISSFCKVDDYDKKEFLGWLYNNH